MANFFRTANDIDVWVKEQGSADQAASLILKVIGSADEQDIVETCKGVFEGHVDSSGVLFAILSKYNITELTGKKAKEEKDMKKSSFNLGRKLGIVKEAQSIPHPAGNVSITRENQNPFFGTPWRKDRDAIYDFTHRNPDMLVFDDDPDHVYSGEAIWRMYVMDKFSRDYKLADGKLAGGYIRDRFQVFHDDGGNPMELGNAERTRQPRPHQYSIERRLEEARNEKTESLVVSGKEGVIKIASAEDIVSLDGTQNPDERKDDKNYAIFSDIVDMKEAGLSDEDIITKVAEHYDSSMTHVARLHQLATKKIEEHASDVYEYVFKQAKKEEKLEKVAAITREVNINGVNAQVEGLSTPQPLSMGTVLVQEMRDGNPILIAANGEWTGKQVVLENMDVFNSFADLGQIQDAYAGLDPDAQQAATEATEQATEQAAVTLEEQSEMADTDFSVNMA